MTKEKSVRKIIKKAIYLAMITSATCCFIGVSQASEVKEHETHANEKRSEIHLSHDLKVILNQEMNEIQEGMMRIIPAISSGNWETIANIAKKNQE